MELADFIRLGQKDPELRFLVIGGYAVAAYGHTRPTFDVDFLAHRGERASWHQRIINAGLNLLGETEAFSQFTQTPAGDSLDLMFVDVPTFEQFWAASEERPFGASKARVPSLDHLLALKLHALKQGLPQRTSKDAQDVELLIRRNGIDLKKPNYESLFLKYGNREIYETFLRILRSP
jgi:hypothetical protein